MLPESKNDTVEVKKLTSLNPRLKIVDGLYDKGNWVRDANTTKTRIFIYKKWFSERRLFSPHGNIWNLDLGKLVVPNVFMDSNLLMDIAKIYHPTIRVVRRMDGECLIKIIPTKI